MELLWEFHAVHVGNLCPYMWETHGLFPLTIPPQFCSLLYVWRLQSSFYSMAVQRYKSTKDNTSVILISFCLDRFFFFFFFLYACHEPQLVSQKTSSSASGQDSTMWDIIWVSSQGHRSVSVSRYFHLQAPQWPCLVRKWFNRHHCCRGRSKRGPLMSCDKCCIDPGLCVCMVPVPWPTDMWLHADR